MTTTNPFLHFIDAVGFYGPNILFIATIFFTWNKLPYLIAFLIGYFFNTKINEVLKDWIREPRPKCDESLQFKYENLPDHGPHKWGMPSAHAQSIVYSISYLYFVTESTKILAFSALLCINTLYQRYKSRVHTAKQLAIGSVLAVLFAYLTFIATKWAKMHPIKFLT